MPVRDMQHIQQAHGVRLRLLLLLFGHKLEPESPCSIDKTAPFYKTGSLSFPAGKYGAAMRPFIRLYPPAYGGQPQEGEKEKTASFSLNP
jgi:hypothetical protein